MTCDVIGFKSPKRTFVYLFWGVLTLLVMWAYGFDQVLEDRIGEIWSAFIALILLLIFIFLTSLILAPSLIQKETDNKITELELKLSDKEARQKAIDELWKYRSLGISIRNKQISNDVEFHHWQSEYYKWRTDTPNVASEVSINLHNWLDRLDRTVSSPLNMVFHNSEHERLARIASTILDRLQKYLERELYREE